MRLQAGVTPMAARIPHPEILAQQGQKRAPTPHSASGISAPGQAHLTQGRGLPRARLEGSEASRAQAVKGPQEQAERAWQADPSGGHGPPGQALQVQTILTRA